LLRCIIARSKVSNVATATTVGNDAISFFLINLLLFSSWPHALLSDFEILEFFVESFSELDFGVTCEEHGVAEIKDFSLPVISPGGDGVLIMGDDGVGKVGGEELTCLEGERVSSLSGDSVD